MLLLVSSPTSLIRSRLQRAASMRMLTGDGLSGTSVWCTCVLPCSRHDGLRLLSFDAYIHGGRHTGIAQVLVRRRHRAQRTTAHDGDGRRDAAAPRHRNGGAAVQRRQPTTAPVDDRHAEGDAASCSRG